MTSSGPGPHPAPARRPAVSRLVQVLAEETTLLGSLLKWSILATMVGVLTGLSTTLFLWVLARASDVVEGLPARLWLLPLGLVTATVLVRLLAPEAEGHGTERVIEAVHRRWGRIPWRVAPVKLTATVVTIATGGSVGKEGPCAQIGAALASTLGSLLQLRRRDHRKLVVCGISAGFATVFGTPIAGSIFGIEVLYLGSLFYDVLYPSFVAGITGYLVASRLGVQYFHERLRNVPQLGELTVVKIMVAGILLGLVALVLVETLRRVHQLVKGFPGHPTAKALAGGLVLALLAFIVSDRYLGLGVETIEGAIRGAWVPSAAFLWKILFTAISLAVGGSGGIVTPIFFIGATAGSVFGDALGFDRGAFGAIGMVSMLAAAANTPLAASIMAIEMFGGEIGTAAAIACIVSFVMVGHRSVYPSQVLAAAKTSAVRVRPGVEIARLDAELRLVALRRLSRWRARRRPPDLGRP